MNGQKCRGKVEVNKSYQRSFTVCCPAKLEYISRFIVNTNVYFWAVICVAFLCLACDKWQWHRKLTNPLVETCPGPGFLVRGGKTAYKKCGVIGHYLIHASRFPADSDVNAPVCKRCILGNLLLYGCRMAHMDNLIYYYVYRCLFYHENATRKY